MKAATWPRDEPLAERLLYVDPRTESFRDAHVGELASFFRAGDLVVVNDAATLPASFHAVNGDVELRLAARLGSDRDWRATLFGAGDFRTPTERRPDPPRLAPGDTVDLGGGLHAEIARVDDVSPRLVDVRFDLDGDALWAALYARGRPIQYAHVPRPLELFHVQNHFASRPWAVEAPSAGRPITWALLLELRRRGVGVTSITHAAGLSSTGSDAIDRRLPFPERYAVGEAACRAVASARETGGRVVAIGTTVVRALESAALANGGVLAPADSDATLVIGPGFVPRVVNGIFSGMHAPGTSHFALLEAFAPRALLERALAHANAAGYLEHEFGDSCLVLATPASLRASSP